ncbi:hypothetical protein P879_02134 [Paragonimus westermani]|uniref:Thiamin pyrophosphokinase thiamin-binding domain-containing protein n=1 Tax=Paragonimus westermani TaxID=34504 RepID=A0A8T0DK39_9TREM|nr:hypothetical protein P879_02134 [Paragonimus westermani]
MASIHTPLSVLSPMVGRKAVIFLNSENLKLHPLFDNLWSGAFPIAFVDGFANLMFSRPDRENFLPQFVTGDFDSINDDALEYYRSKNSVHVIETPDQIATDFTKCIRILNEFIQKEPKADVIVGAYISGGRSDHEFGLIKSLYEAHKMRSIPVYLVSDYCVSLLLQEGQHTIHANTGFEGKHVGLIPVGKPCMVTTRGLMWNLKDQLLSFDDLVSTSNALTDKIIHISCDNPLLMTMEYNPGINKHLF